MLGQTTLWKSRSGADRQQQTRKPHPMRRRSDRTATSKRSDWLLGRLMHREPKEVLSQMWPAPECDQKSGAGLAAVLDEPANTPGEINVSDGRARDLEHHSAEGVIELPSTKLGGGRGDLWRSALIFLVCKTLIAMLIL